MASDHKNTDYGNTTCFCPIGKDHGNLPMEQRETVLRAILRHCDVELLRVGHDNLVRPSTPEHTPRVKAVLQSFGLRPKHRSSDDRGGRGLLISAAQFNA